MLALQMAGCGQWREVHSSQTIHARLPRRTCSAKQQNMHASSLPTPQGLLGQLQLGAGAGAAVPWADGPGLVTRPPLLAGAVVESAAMAAFRSTCSFVYCCRQLMLMSCSGTVSPAQHSSSLRPCAEPPAAAAAGGARVAVQRARMNRRSAASHAVSVTTAPFPSAPRPESFGSANSPSQARSPSPARAPRGTHRSPCQPAKCQRRPAAAAARRRPHPARRPAARCTCRPGSASTGGYSHPPLSRLRR